MGEREWAWTLLQKSTAIKRSQDEEVQSSRHTSFRHSLPEDAGKYFDKENRVLEAPMTIRVADQVCTGLF